MISHISLPHTPIRRHRRHRPVATPSLQAQRSGEGWGGDAFNAATPLPALVSCKRNGRTFLARVGKTKDLNGHLFAHVQFADGTPLWTNAVNIVEVV